MSGTELQIRFPLNDNHQKKKAEPSPNLLLDDEIPLFDQH
jgi:hypothetical protein